MSLKSIDGKSALSCPIGTILESEGEKYITKIVDSSVGWVLIDQDKVSVEPSVEPNDKDDILDQFQNKDTAFLMIGNCIGCLPCRRAKNAIKAFIKEQNDDTLALVEWKFNMITGKLDEPTQQRWHEREKTRDKKYAEFKTIPKIWHDGVFIGGENDLYDVLSSKYDWN